MSVYTLEHSNKKPPMITDTSPSGSQLNQESPVLASNTVDPEQISNRLHSRMREPYTT